ncbi:MAG: hypothetical protein PHT01_06170, partial [Spirochaetales bacterium]|nr:hypothetical protein [Spirochaetales bacterium]
MKNTACAVAKGVCGKTAEVSDLQDLVLHVCKGIGFWAVKAAEKGVYDEDAAFFVDRMLFATITNANFSPSDFERWIAEGLAHRDSLRAAFVAAGGKLSGGLPNAATWSAANVEAIRAAAAAGIGGWKEIADENV